MSRLVEPLHLGHGEGAASCAPAPPVKRVPPPRLVRRTAECGCRHKSLPRRTLLNSFATVVVRLSGLPADFRFTGSEVYVRRDAATGDVILSRRQDSSQDFFDLIDRLDFPDDYLSNRRDRPPQKRKLF